MPCSALIRRQATPSSQLSSFREHHMRLEPMYPPLSQGIDMRHTDSLGIPGRAPRKGRPHSSIVHDEPVMRAISHQHPEKDDKGPVSGAHSKPCSSRISSWTRDWSAASISTSMEPLSALLSATGQARSTLLDVGHVSAEALCVTGSCRQAWLLGDRQWV